jgi:hypothetical protein
MTITLPPSLVQLFGPDKFMLTGSAIAFSLAMVLGAAMQPLPSSGPRQEYRPFNWAHRNVTEASTGWSWTSPFSGWGNRFVVALPPEPQPDPVLPVEATVTPAPPQQAPVPIPIDVSARVALPAEPLTNGAD